ncbi:MAG: amidohydrolase [Gammaproteobacteria bacterium]|nr:amidohydrolase [Gammaproteobacteria bacterium]
MLPVVDTNWCLPTDVANSRHDPAEVHILRAVSVQAPGRWEESLRFAQSAQTLADTPGSGGLPTAFVAYADIVDTHFYSRLDVLTGFSRFRGISYQLPTCVELPQLLACVKRLGEVDVLLELVLEDRWFDCASTLMALRSKGPIVLQLDATQLDVDGGHCENDEFTALWSEHFALQRALSGNARYVLKMCGDWSKHALIQGLEIQTFLQQLINIWGVDRIVFGGEPVSKAAQNNLPAIWNFFQTAALSLSASERDRLFRSNAVNIYRL